MKKISVRFNTFFPEKSKFQWRVIEDGKEHLVNAVRIETPVYSTSEFIEGIGLKHHLTTEANFFEITGNYAIGLTAYIK